MLSTSVAGGTCQKFQCSASAQKAPHFERQDDPFLTSIALSSQHSFSLSSFAQAPLWPAFDGSARQAMHITAPASFVEDDGVKLCAGLWDDIGYLY